MKRMDSRSFKSSRRRKKETAVLGVTHHHLTLEECLYYFQKWPLFDNGPFLYIHRILLQYVITSTLLCGAE